MPKKLSSYQKMKLKYEKRINELQSDIKVLVDGSGYDATMMKYKYRFKYDLERTISYGEFRSGENYTWDISGKPIST